MSTSVSSVRSRGDIPVEDTWDVTVLYANDAAWEVDFNRVESLIPGIEALRGTLADGPDALLALFEKQAELWMLAEQVRVYSYLRGDEDTTNTHYQALEERASSLMARVSAATAWIEPEMLHLSDDQLRSYLKQSPELQAYERIITELIRMRPHVRSAEVEELLAQASEVSRGAGSIFTTFVDADLAFPAITDADGHTLEVTNARYGRLLENPDREVRRQAFESIHSTYKSYRNMLASTYAANVRGDIFFARASGYESAVEAHLKPHDIPLSVYENLVATVKANADKIQRYLRLRKRILELDELHTYDLYTPLTKGTPPQFDFDDAAGLILNSVAPLGPEYMAVLGQGLESRWIDKYENKHKRGGAYSSGAYTSPPFVLMNYQDTMDSMYTLAHELGHSMHSHFTRSTQPYQYGRYTLFVAEVASTLNEVLLSEYLLKTSDDPRLHFQVITQQLNDVRTTLFRQTLFAEFELEAHRQVEAGQALTADSLSELYMGLIKQYYGSELIVEKDLDIEWARIPHFYRSFYVYQYATGISAALALGERIKHEGDVAAEDYLRFLRGGSSLSSIELLRNAGVDMTTPEPVQRAMDSFARWLDQLESLLD